MRRADDRGARVVRELGEQSLRSRASSTRRAARSARRRRRPECAPRRRGRERRALAGRPRGDRRAVSACAARPTAASASAARSRASSGSIPRSARPSSTFSRAERNPESPGAWPTTAMRSRRIAARVARSCCETTVARQAHLALVRDVEPGEESEQRRLARARGADDDCELPGKEHRVHVVESDLRAVPSRDSARLEDLAAHAFEPRPLQRRQLGAAVDRMQRDGSVAWRRFARGRGCPRREAPPRESAASRRRRRPPSPGRPSAPR